MNFVLPINLPKSPLLIHHQQKILSIGSCFTEHIGTALQEVKFNVLQNPNGILFDPVSVCNSLTAYIRNEQYAENDLFYLNELWQSWQHHSRFSGVDKEKVLSTINTSQARAHQFLKNADWLIITLGSAFCYRIVKSDEQIKPFSFHNNAADTVANCHRAPAQWFRKILLTTEDIIARLDNTIHQLFHFNSRIGIIFTISPVRHIRDGVVDNNRSKARLIEAVHHLVHKFDRLYYFPAYELVIDVLRDYRFYDIDLVHPNYTATQFVLQHFMETYMSEETQQLVEQLKKLVTARKHRSANPQTEAHKKFLQSHLLKTKAILEEHPFLDLTEELAFFCQPA